MSKQNQELTPPCSGMKLRKRSIWLVLLAGFCALYVILAKRNFPYGVRSARLPIVLYALRDFANDHGGEFPSADADPLKSLALLYPQYLPDPVDLAGISGNESEVRKRLSGGGHLNSSISSWVYWPGLNITNDAVIAILWERMSGVAFNGRRTPGRVVGFVDGSMRQIPDQQWEVFLREQEALRKSVEQPVRNEEGTPPK